MKIEPVSNEIIRICLAGLTGLLLTACGGSGGGSGSSDGGSDSGTGTVTIAVYGLEDAPLFDGSVTLQNTTQPLVEGQTTFNDVPAGRQIFQVSADGFTPGSVVMEVQANTGHQATRTLLPVGHVYRFDPSASLNVNYETLRLELPANALRDSSGAAVTGDVDVLLTPLDPATQIAASPGPLEGIASDAAVVDMETFYMADVRFQQGGEDLQLAPGQTATLELRLPDSVNYPAGSIIPAWWYDADEGRWREEGSGTIIERSGIAYWQAEVSHFTFWNADAAIEDKNCLQIRVVDDETDEPLNGVPVSTTGITYQGTSTMNTIIDGLACMDFKRNERVRVNVSAPQGYAESVEVTGTTVSSSCGTGGCQNFDVRVKAPGCMQGQVNRLGAPADGVRVVANFDNVYFESATTDATGAYCLPVKQGSLVSLRVARREGGAIMAATASVTAPSVAGQCGSANCGLAPILDLEPPPQFCARGTATANPGELGGSDITLPAGTPVYAFRATSFAGKDCSQPPESWGSIVASGVVGPGGTYCLDTVFDDDRAFTVVADTCSFVLPECDLSLSPGYCRTTSEMYRDPTEDSTAIGGSCMSATESCIDMNLYFSDPT